MQNQVESFNPEFSSLVTELHELIIDQLEINDLPDLSLTSWYFWSLVRPHIQSYYLSFLGQWAGERIICLGEHTGAGDYPSRPFYGRRDQRTWTTCK